MMVSLAKGQTISLAKTSGPSLTKAVMGLGWDAKKVKKLFGLMSSDQAIDLDASCIILDEQRKAIDAVWFRQLSSKDGSIVHSGDNRTGEGEGDDEQIVVDLSRLSPQAKYLVFVVSSFTGESFDQIENAFCRLVDANTGQEIARYELSGSGSHTAQVMAKLTREADGWHMTAIGERASGRTINDLMPAVARCL